MRICMEYILCEFVEHSFETTGSKQRRLSKKMYKYSKSCSMRQLLRRLSKKAAPSGFLQNPPGSSRPFFSATSLFVSQKNHILT